MTDVALLKYRLSEVFKSVHSILTKHAEQENSDSIQGDTLNEVASLWSYGPIGGKDDYQASDVCVMMALLKIARIRTGVSVDDSFHDAMGYLALGYLHWLDEHGIKDPKDKPTELNGEQA